jgi:rRNA maturation RNase YbeY
MYLCAMSSISFVYKTQFELKNPQAIQQWICNCLDLIQHQPKQITMAFMDDDSLLEINQNFLNHNYFTDVITFDYSIGKEVSCDIAISIDRVLENASQQNNEFDEELRRVIIHGVLHCCGYNDKTAQEKTLMTQKENECLQMFHVEPNNKNNV